MKTLAIFFFCIFTACSNQQIKYENYWGNKNPILPLIRDTINITDANGLKQGLWIIDNKTNMVEEGIYKDNKREGVWRFILSNINLSKITYTVLYKNNVEQKINPDSLR